MIVQNDRGRSPFYAWRRARLRADRLGLVLANRTRYDDFHSRTTSRLAQFGGHHELHENRSRRCRARCRPVRQRGRRRVERRHAGARQESVRRGGVRRGAGRARSTARTRRPKTRRRSPNTGCSVCSRWIAGTRRGRTSTGCFTPTPDTCRRPIRPRRGSRASFATCAGNRCRKSWWNATPPPRRRSSARIRGAAQQFDDVLALLDDRDLDQTSTLSDLRAVASAFRDLAKAVTAFGISAAEAKSAQPGAPTREPVRDVIYTAADTDVTPPVAQSQKMPIWRPSPREAAREFKGALRLLIDESGAVVSATMPATTRADYDSALIRPRASGNSCRRRNRVCRCGISNSSRFS